MERHENVENCFRFYFLEGVVLVHVPQNIKGISILLITTYIIGLANFV